MKSIFWFFGVLFLCQGYGLAASEVELVSKNTIVSKHTRDVSEYVIGIEPYLPDQDCMKSVAMACLICTPLYLFSNWFSSCTALRMPEETIETSVILLTGLIVAGISASYCKESTRKPLTAIATFIPAAVTMNIWSCLVFSFLNYLFEDFKLV